MGPHSRNLPMDSRRYRWRHALVLALYLAASLLMFGLPVLPRMRSMFVGRGNTDVKFLIWCMKWWPHAISSGLNPFHATVVWAPNGANLAWDGGIPGLSLLGWPITATAGPVAAYNVLALLAPALAAWTAYLLCDDLTRAFWPSVAGGLVFGFSSYEVAQLGDAMNLFFVALVPLAVLLTVRYAQDRMTNVRFVTLVSAVLLGQFPISTEILATMALIVGIALVVALVADLT